MYIALDGLSRWLKEPGNHGEGVLFCLIFVTTIRVYKSLLLKVISANDGYSTYTVIFDADTAIRIHIRDASGLFHLISVCALGSADSVWVVAKSPARADPAVPAGISALQ